MLVPQRGVPSHGHNSTRTATVVMETCQRQKEAEEVDFIQLEI